MTDDSDSLPDPQGPESASPESASPESASPDASRTGNARRVARHKAKLAEAGLKQVNIQAPMDAHPILKDLGRRLKAGQPIEEALFELAALHARDPGTRRTDEGPGLTGRLGWLFRGRSEP